MPTPAPGTIPALPYYQAGALPLSGDERIEIVSTGQATSAVSYQMLLTDLVGKAPSVMTATLPAASDLCAFFQVASGLPRVATIGSFGVQAGNMPTGGSTGQLFYKLSGVNYQASFTGITNFVQSQSGLFTTGSATAVLFGISTAAISSVQLATAAVGSVQLATGAVGSTQLATGAVGSTQLATGAVGSTQLATGGVVAANFTPFAIGSAQLATAAVGTAQLAPFAVGSGQLNTGAVGAAQLAPFAIGSGQLATGGVAFANLTTVPSGAALGGWLGTTVSATIAPVLGTAAATGSLGLAGFTSGVVTLLPGAGTFGNWSFYLPTAAAATTTPSQALIGGTATGPCGWTTVLTSLSAGWGLLNTAGSTPITSTGTLALATAAPARGIDMIVNLSMTAATIAPAALSISFLNNAGSNASAGSPILVPFQNTNITTAVPQWAAITGPLSLTTVMTATLGASNASVPFRFWVVLFWQNATTVLPALINCSNATQIFTLTDYLPATSALMSATSASCGVFYTNGTAVASLTPFKIAGFLEYGGGLGSAGLYSTGPTLIRLFGPGSKRPNDIVQSLFTSTLNSTTFIATAAFTNVGFPAVFTPFSAVNPVAITSMGQIGSTAAGPWTAVMGLARAGSTVPGAAVNIAYGGSGPGNIPYSLNVTDLPATTGPVTYNVVGQTNNAVAGWNRQVSGTSAATLQFLELMG